MSERKMDEIEQMFKKTAATSPKLEITNVPIIDRIGAIFDNTLQGNHAILIASSLTKKLDASLNVLASQDFSEAFKRLIETTQEDILDLVVRAKEYTEQEGVEAKIDTILSTRISQVLQDFQSTINEEDKLSGKLISTIKEVDSDLLIIGVPLFYSGDETETEEIGSYATKLLRTKGIRSNFMLVTERTTELEDSILGFVSVNQQPRSVVALTKRALSLSKGDTKIHIVGMVEDRTIETMARAELPEDDPEALIPLEDVSKRLKTKMQDTLDRIHIANEEIEYGSLTDTVLLGSISSIVTKALENEKPGLVIVRSVAEIRENLDPIAEQVTRLVLGAGIPVLIVWD
ncbi:MAG: hypothetical protein ACXAD7_07085 [Candidatus Kariarchaeaceae archaeon]|jgi:hypothetical protein